MKYFLLLLFLFKDAVSNLHYVECLGLVGTVYPFHPTEVTHVTFPFLINNDLKSNFVLHIYKGSSPID